MHKSKCRPYTPSSAPSGLPLATICLLSVLLMDQMSGIGALRCYQTQTSIMQAVTGSATECPMMAWSCIKSVDYTQGQGMVTRACQSSNCSMGIPGNQPMCTNSSSYPPQTFCCCYGDGCNSSLRAALGVGWPWALAVALGTLAFVKWTPRTFV